MIQLEIGFKVDARSLEGQLSTIQKDINKAFEVKAGSTGMGKELSQAVIQARTFSNVLQKASTTKGLSFIGMNAELRKAGTTATSMVTDLMRGGDYFQGTANVALQSFSNANRQAIKMNETLKEAGRVFVQSFKFTAAQMAIQALQTSIQDTVQWVVRLDKELNQIQVVSGKTADQMGGVSREIVERSKALRVAALDYAQASQIYYQQGLKDEEVIRRSDITIKAAQAANENVKNMSDMLTAVWNTYQMQGEELDRAASIGAMLGADTAIEFRDIAEAMQISASAASQMGVSYESLASIIATVGSNTRQSASIIGNAYKTIFARFQQLKAEGTDGEVTLGKVSEDLESIGVDILDDVTGELINLDQIIMKTGTDWGTYTKKQQLAIAQLVGGTRQYGQFISLMENFDDYVANLNKSMSQTDASVLEQQYETTLDSLDSRIANTAEAWKRAFSNLYDEDGTKGMLSALEEAGNLVGDLIKGFGGISGILGTIGAMLITKIPSALTSVKGIVTDIKDSMNPARRIARINRDVDSMRDQFNAYQTSRMPNSSDNTPQAQRLTAQINIETAQGLNKLELTREMAVAQENLNNIMQNGNNIEQTQAQNLKTSAEEQHKILNNLYDEIAAYQKLLEVRNQNIQSQTSVAQRIPELELLERGMANGDIMDTAYNTAIKLDSSGFEQDSEQILALISSLEAGEMTLRDFTSQYNTTVGAIGKLRLNQVTDESKKLAQSFSDLGKVLSSGFANPSTAKGLEQAKVQLTEVNKVLKDMINNSELTQIIPEDAYQELLIIQSGLQDILNNTNLSMSDVEDSINSLIPTLRNAFNPETLGTNINPQMREMATQVNALITAYEQGQITIGEFGRSLTELNVIGGNVQATNANLTQSMFSMASGIAMVTRGISSLIDSAENGTLSIGTVMSAIMMLSQGLFMATKAYKMFINTQTGGAAVTAVTTAVTTAYAGANNVLWGSFLGATAGAKALGAQMKVLMVESGPVGWIILAIVAAIYALIKVIGFLYTAWKNSTPEAQLRRQQKAVEDLKTAAEEAKTAAEELNATFNNYYTAREALDNCTRGTEEWKKQLQETNKAALSVIDSIDIMNNKDISLKGLYKRENGELKLNEEIMKNVLTSVQNNTSQLEIQASLVGLVVDDTALNNQFDKLVEQLNLYNIGNNTPENYLTNNIRRLADMGLTELEEELKKLSGRFYNISDKDLPTLQKSIRDVALSTENFTEKQNAASEIIMNEMFKDVGSDIIKEIAAQSISPEAIKENMGSFGAWENLYDMYGSYMGLNKRFNTIADDFSEAMGINYRAASNFARKDDSGTQTYAFVNEDTGETKEYSREAVQLTIASNKALEGLGKAAETAKERISNLGDSDLFGENTLNETTAGRFLAGNGYQDLTSEQIDQVRNSIGMDEININGTFEEAPLPVLIDFYEKVGFSYEESTKRAEQLIQAERDLQLVRESLNTTIAQNENLTLKQQDQLTKVFDSIGRGIQTVVERDGGTEIKHTGSESVGKTIGSLISDTGLSEENQQKAAEQLANIDWSGWNAGETAISIIRALGGELDDFDIEGFVHQINQAAGAIEDLSVSGVQAVNKIIKSLKSGDEIKAADYSTLIASNNAWAAYFSILEDGSAVFRGTQRDIENMTNITYESTLALMQQRKAMADTINWDAMQVSREDGSKDTIDWSEIANSAEGEFTAVAEAVRNRSGENFSKIADILEAQGYDLSEMTAQSMAAVIMEYQNTEIAIYDTAMAMAATATTLEQVNSIFASSGGIAAVYVEGLRAVAAQYENTTAELDAYNAAYQTYLSQKAAGEVTAEVSDNLGATEDQLRASIVAGEGAKKYGFDAEATEIQANELQLKALADGYELSAEAAARLAVANQRLQIGLDELNSNWKDWSKALKDNDKGSANYANTLASLSKSVRDITGTTDDFIVTSEFLEENLALIEAASKGGEEAINALGIAVAKSQINDLTFDGDFDTFSIEGFSEKFGAELAAMETDAERFAAIQGNVVSFLDQLAASIDGFKAGDILSEVMDPTDVANFIDSMNQLAYETGMSVADLNAHLNSMGIEAEVGERVQEGKTYVQGYTEAYEEGPSYQVAYPNYSVGSEGEPEVNTTMVNFPGVVKYSVPTAPKEFTTSIAVPYIKTEGKGGPPKIKGTSAVKSGNNKPSGGGKGGGGGGGKKSTYKKPSEKPRYVNNTNRQKATANAADKISSVEDKLYGRARLAAMEKKNQLVAEQARDYQRLYKEAQNYLALDKESLAATRLGQTMQIEFAEDGSLLNQEQIDNWMIDWKDAIDQIEDETAKETEQIAYDLSETAWNHLKDSREKMIEYLKAGIEELQKWIEQQIETANYQYEIDVKVNDREIRMLEYTLNKLGQSGLMTGEGLSIIQDKVESFFKVADSGMGTADKLIELYDSMKTGNINNQLGSELFGPEVWAEAIKNGSLTATILDAISENTEDLITYAEELAAAYVAAWEQVSNALAAYLDEFDSINKKMENSSALLETWISIWDVSGAKYKDNSTYLKLLETRMDAVGTSVETTKDKYMALQEAESEAKEAWDIHREMYEEGEITGQQWDAVNEAYKAARDAMLDAQGEYYSSVQDYISAIKEYEQQAAEQIAYSWDQALTNMWADISDSMTGYDKITAIQEFFLDDYEKNYHLDTLLRQTDDAMSDLTDPGRLSEYQKFLDEITAKQAEGVQLTQTDVDILNARFKLLQAQDAYEEAQNSKNTMRLARDNSGNYSYVFSGDDTSSSEQDLADAAYDLHKITEEAAKQAASSWYETWLEYQNYVKEIDQTRYNSDEKYAQQVDYMRQMYETQLVQLKDKVIEYNDMAGYTFAETALGLMTQSDNMQHVQETYVDAVGDLFTELNDLYKEYDAKIEDTANKFENANGNMKDSAEDAMTSVRDQMRETIRESGNLAESMADNWTQMIRDTSDWSLETIDQINAVIEKLEEYYRRQTEVMRNDDGLGVKGDYFWQSDDNGWWYGDGQGGYMKAGWFQDDKGDWYYANEDGYISQGTWVAGYEVDDSGKWTGGMEAGHTEGAWKQATDTKPSGGGTYNEYADGTVGSNTGPNGSNDSDEGNFSNSEDDQWHGPPWWYGNSERALYNGWKKINGKWYHFNSQGYIDSAENGLDQKGSGSTAEWKAYSTGGFTGSTPGGGLKGIDQFPAMLAPGEYVLNPDDTTKILKAVSIVKGLSSSGLSSAAEAIISLASGAAASGSGKDITPVQQDVRIEASFPGVSNSSEIEDAFNNLINETVQLIGSRNR